MYYVNLRVRVCVSMVPYARMYYVNLRVRVCVSMVPNARVYHVNLRVRVCASMVPYACVYYVNLRVRVCIHGSLCLRVLCKFEIMLGMKRLRYADANPFRIL